MHSANNQYIQYHVQFLALHLCLLDGLLSSLDEFCGASNVLLLQILQYQSSISTHLVQDGGRQPLAERITGKKAARLWDIMEESGNSTQRMRSTHGKNCGQLKFWSEHFSSSLLPFICLKNLFVKGLFGCFLPFNQVHCEYH